MNSDLIREQLCQAFCRDITVKAVPAGLAVSGSFEDVVGDPIRCYVEQYAGGWRLADDGQFLADLDGRGINRRQGPRADYLAQIFASAGAGVGEDGLQIATSVQAQPPLAGEIIQFLSALTRARDVMFWSRERIKSTFKEDVFHAMEERLSGKATLERASFVEPSLRDFPADVIITPKGMVGAPRTAVFLAQSTEPLGDALLLWQELRLRGRSDIRVAAVVESGSVSNAALKLQRVINRIDAVTFFSGDEDAAIERIERTALAPP